MIDADLVEQALAKTPQKTNFPSFLLRLILFFRLIPGFSA
jgi:hypothetical protein